MISKMDIKRMPFTFIFGPIFLVFLIGVVVITYGEFLEEKEFIFGLSCTELETYAQNQEFESKLYFGNEAYLSLAQERYSSVC